MDLLLNAKQAAKALGVGNTSSETIRRILHDVGLKPVNQPENGHRFHARYRFEDVSMAVVKFEELKKAAEERAAERREKEAQEETAKEAKAAARKLDKATAQSDLAEFTRVLLSLSKDIAELKSMVTEVHKLWTEE